MKKQTAWWIACGFLAGYLFAWGTISIDRHLILKTQRQLQQELDRTRKELRLKEIVLEAEYQMRRDIEWNRQAIDPPVEEDK